MRVNNSLPQTITHWAQSSMSALSSGFAGLLNSGNQHQEASQDLMNGMTLGTNSEQQGVNVSISQEYHQRMRGSDNPISVERTLPSPESSVASINEAGVTYSASARLVKATSAMVDAFFDAIA